MKTKFTLFYALLAFTATSFSQSPAIDWQKSFGSISADQARTIQQTTDGGYIVVGYAGASNADVTGGHGNNDIWVIKLSSSGTMQWKKAFGGSLNDYGYSIQQTPDGGYIVAGQTSSTDGDAVGNDGGFDAWVLKLTSTGVLEWQKTYGGSSAELGYAIQNTFDGGYILASITSSITNFGDVTGNHGATDIWVVKLSNSGIIQWQKSLGGTGSDQGRDIQQAADGSFIAVGYTLSNNGNVSGNHGLNDVWVVKLSSTGSLLWQKALGGTASEFAYGIQVTADGGAVLAGYTSSNDGDVSGLHGSTDGWVVKLSSTGSLEWQKTYGGSAPDTFQTIQKTTDGGYIVAGNTSSNNGDVSGLRGAQDFWVVKLSSTGVLQWQKAMGGTGNDTAQSIQQTADGSYVIAGFSSSYQGDLTLNQGGTDYWVVKLAPTPVPTATPQAFCTGATVTNLVATGTALQWYSVASGGTALATNTVLVSGNYYVSQTLFASESVRIVVAVTVGASTTWNGTSWSNGIPDSTKAIIFTGNYNSSSDINACSINVTNNASVVISSGKNVTLNGAVAVDSGSTLTFENNSNLIQHTNVANSGNVIVKRDTNPLMRLDYTLWSSPVVGQQLQAFSPQTLSNRFYTYNSTTNFYNPISTPETTNFDIGKGYLIRLPNDHPVTPTIWSGQFQGVLNNGNYTFTVAANKYNAIGNPYPSVINADSFIVNNSLTDALYFWRKTNNSANSSYATYTLAGGTSNSGGASSIEPNGIIQIGQGFIMKSALSNVVFSNSIRMINNTNQFLKSSTVEKHRIWLNFYGESLTANQLLVSYMTGATNGVDPGIDGTYINDSPIALNSYLNNGEYIIQGRALPFTDADVVPLTFKTTIAGNYTIAIDHVDGLFSDNQNIYIRDIFTGVVHDLKQSVYSYTTTTGTFNNRFELVYTSAQLSTQNPIFNENSIVVYKQNEVLHIHSGNTEMKSVRIFDMRGRLIYEQKNLQTPSLAIKDLTVAPQVLIVQITAANDQMVSKKVVY